MANTRDEPFAADVAQCRAATARRSLAAIARAANVTVAGIVLAAAVGWVVDSDLLRTFGADFPALQLSSAIAFLIAAAALDSAQGGGARGVRRARAGAAAVAVIAALMLAGHALGIRAGLDLAFLGLARGGTHVPVLMPVASALALELVAAAIAVATCRGPWTEVANRVAAAALLGIALLAIVGLSFRLLLEYGVAPLFGMAVPDAIAFLLLGISLLAGRPDAWLADLVTAERPGAVMSRWLLPAAIVVPILAHLAQLFAQRLGVVDEPLGQGLLVLLTVAGLGAFTLWIGHALDRMNARRVRAEEEARTQRESLQIVLGSIGEGVIATDRSGRVRFMNAAAQRLASCAESAAVGRPAGELLQVADERTGERLELPLERAVSARETVYGGGEPALRVGAAPPRPVDLSATPILDAQGAVTGAVLVLRDASRRREAERAMRAAYDELDARVVERTAALERATAALSERNRLFATITGSTSDLIFAKDVAGRLLMVNAAYLAAIGRAEGDVIGRTSLELATDPEAGRAKADHDRVVVESGRSLTVEEVFPANERRVYLTTKSPLRDDDGRIVGLVGVATDITERKRAERALEELLGEEQQLREEAERANRAKDEFLAIVSHELRSPLNALRGWGHLLASTRPLEPGLVERATAAIKRNVEHQARLIDDILDTSRSISGKLAIERVPVNLVDVVHAAVEIARPAAAAKKVALYASLAHAAATVEGDAGRLQQVLTNLLSNAIKFTPQQGAVEVSLVQAGDRIRLAVRDNGAGIAPEFLPHVFERFTQADTSSTRRAGGLGIGLALVRNIVDLHGGQVRAESAGPDRGATFTVELPAAGTAAPAPAAPAPETAAPAHGVLRLEGLDIVLVDDDPDARDTIGLALRQAGAAVADFPSGDAALARLDERLPADPPDVLLLDLAMPGEDGFAVLARIRALERSRDVRRVPAIAVTAVSQTDRGRLRAAGFQDLVGKPVDTDRLVAAILALVRAADAPRELPERSV
jgi:PAS domain S-box-containing protein